VSIQIKLSSTLRHLLPDYDPFEEYLVDHVPGEKLSDLLERLKMEPSEIKIFMVNGRATDLEEPINDGDRVALFPTVGGG
jgi:molybdopterin synthase sulfur carrier subunit